MVSNDTNNRHNNVITIIPITPNIDSIFSFEVFIPKGEANLPKDYKAKIDQIRTIDKARLAKIISILSDKYVQEIDVALMLHLDL